MMRIAGVVVLLIGLYIALPLSHPNALGKSNLIDVTNRQGLWGIITVGVAILIITGAIDLSIGSVVGFSAIAAGLMMTSGINVAGVRSGPLHPYVVVPIVLLLGSIIGLVNGFLVTRLKLQSFLVTLCGLFVYRGLARYMAGTSPVGLVGITEVNPSFRDPINSLRYLVIGKDERGVLLFPAEIV